MLKVEKLNTYITNIHILRDVELNVEEGEAVCIVGPNGAGKTTTLKSILGIYPYNGKILFRNIELNGMPTYLRVRLGIGYVPEDRRIYPNFTVKENILLPIKVMKLKGNKEKVLSQILDVFPELEKLLERKGNALSGGEQKMVAISRALAISPSLILLDEALEGLAPIVRVRLINAIKKLREKGITFLMAESNIRNIQKIVDKTYKIARGVVSLE